jgi:hypothetical protein
MTDRLNIVPKSVVGTGDPMDVLMVIPLLSSWGASRACGLAPDGDACEAPLQRIVIVDHTDPPGELATNTTLAFCEPHFQAMRGVPA